MVMWVFGYGSLIWKAGFHYDERIVGFIKGYRRVFYQGSTDHRGTPSFPGRTVTLEPAPHEVCVSLHPFTSLQFLLFGDHTTHSGASLASKNGLSIKLEWGVAYKVCGKEDEMIALTYLEVREKQYDQKAYTDLFTDPSSSTPAVCGVMVYVASPDTTVNKNYLGPAPIEEIAKQIIQAEGPSGPNRDYLFHLEAALRELGCQDLHVRDVADAVRKLLSEKNM